jgi:hypothetical protein
VGNALLWTDLTNKHGVAAKLYGLLGPTVRRCDSNKGPQSRFDTRAKLVAN